MAKIFVSYRRTDSDIAGRIADRMIDTFGEESVFLDVENIPIGKDFRKVIDEAITFSDCIILVIGAGWIRASKPGSETSGDLTKETDFVRLEVKSALQADLTIIPVLVNGVDMPDASELPEDIRDIAFINATTVRSGRDFRTDINTLIAGIKALVKTNEQVDSTTTSNLSPTGTTNLAQSVHSDTQTTNSNALTFNTNELINQPQSLINQTVGRYKLKQFIAAGGGGAVFRAIDVNLSIELCIKIAYPLREKIANLRQLISKSVKGLVRMRHPNVVQITDFDSITLMDGNKAFFIVMDLEQGDNLLEWAHKLPNDVSGFLKRIECIKTICQTLSDAHNFSYIDDDGMECIGVLHGDIKPNNVIMRSDKPLLLDFMLVDLQQLQAPLVQHRIDTDQDITMAFGTPSFMAPEQEDLGIITRKTDIYSLGKTLEKLFSINHLISANKHKSSTGWEQARTKLIEIAKQCCEFDPNNRPKDMASIIQLLDSVEDILNNNKIQLKAEIDASSPPIQTSEIVQQESHNSTQESHAVFCCYCGKSNIEIGSGFICAYCHKDNAADLTMIKHSCQSFTPYINYCRKCGEKLLTN